jgi:hypothetical protein
LRRDIRATPCLPCQPDDPEKNDKDENDPEKLKEIANNCVENDEGANCGGGGKKIKTKHTSWTENFEEYARWTLRQIEASHGMNFVLKIYDNLGPTGPFAKLFGGLIKVLG